jgi:RNA polymerase sigma-70 factor, ECF subfamily
VTDVIDCDWMDAALRGARPRALAALLRYFGTLDEAEEAFQDASLTALTTWPQQGPPRDPASWLILVGRNRGIDEARRRNKQAPLDDGFAACDDDIENDLAGRLDDGHYRDDILRLLFVCCHHELSPTQQLALSLRIVCGLSVPQIARAFLVSEVAMEQRITRAKQRVSLPDVAFETPDSERRSARLSAVATVLYLMFNEGYAATCGDIHVKTPLCDEAIRLTRLLLRLFADQPCIMGLLSLMLLQHARAAARIDETGNIVLLDQQDRSLWDRQMIAEGLVVLDKAMQHRNPDPFQVQAAIAALHARAASPADTDWHHIERLYATLERLQPSAVVTLNRAVAVLKTQGPAAALEMIEPLAKPLSGYFYYFGLLGALLAQLGRGPEARDAFGQAIALAKNPTEAAHIRCQLEAICAS